MNSASTLISVIIPNYNNADYIDDCLSSVLNQTHKNIEVIVADDGSTDESKTIIQRYERECNGIVKGIYHPRNKGVASNRHSAIVEARGDYIATLDSDDYYCDSRKLEREMAVISLHKNNFQKDVCAFSNVVLVKDDKTVIQRAWATPDNLKEGMLLEDIICRSCFIPRDFLHRRSAYFEVGGYDCSLPIYEDWDLKIRLAARYPFYYSGSSGGAYRRHGHGLSNTPLTEHIRIMGKIFNNHINLVPENKRHEVREKYVLFEQRILAEIAGESAADKEAGLRRTHQTS